MTSNKKSDEIKKLDSLKHTKDDAVGENEKVLALRIFHLIERIILIIVVVMTSGAVAFELQTIYVAQTIILADILLMFLYLEVIGMVAVFYSDPRSAFVYPIFIAITAIARLIVLQGKEMAPENILYEAIAILILSIAAIVIIKMRND
ncbi:phosphate-starvation-inducible protein PsiE [Colwellia sp. C1TZA3]|uniref:phosphate-starvation-inducible protein PsiE n=1 Tax=Colwellia sp. C1TZA3 TaxID=2508879 RepID=UPI0011B9AC9F|nr:phosphate-starvation-inducible PsiE family protein [Colwellia sp. C1TZA3]TWX63503.1 phosphate-starvation-inducible E [Colwellia sp. C1TZA3]